MLHALALWQVLPGQPVGVLVGAALPGVVGGAEVEAHIPLLLDLGIAMELGAVIRGEGLEQPWCPLDDLVQPLVEAVDGAVVELADEGQPGAAFDQADGTVKRAGACDRIDLPVAELLAQLDVLRPFRDMPFAGQASAAVVSAVTFSALLIRAAQVLVEGAASLLVGPDPLIDRFVADPGDAVDPQDASDLLRAPILAQQHGHGGPGRRTNPQVTPGAAASSAGPAARLKGPVSPVVQASVPLQLAADSARMPAKVAGDLGLLVALPVQRA